MPLQDVYYQYSYFTPLRQKNWAAKPAIMARPRGLRLCLYRTYIINIFIVHPCGHLYNVFYTYTRMVC